MTGFLRIVNLDPGLRCLFFKNTFISNIMTWHSGKVDEHRNRIINKMNHTNEQVPAKAFLIILMSSPWRRFWNFLPSTRKGTTSDADIDVLQKYIQDVGTRASETRMAGFVSACDKAINGRRDIKDSAMEVVYWEQAQMRMIELLLDHLVTESYLTTYLEPEAARKFVQGVDDQAAQISFCTIHARLSGISFVRSLLRSPNCLSRQI